MMYFVDIMHICHFQVIGR